MAGEQVIQYMELLTGGSSTAVDGIDGDDRGDGEAITLDDITYANVSGVHYVYKYTATAAVESVPDIIRPDVNNDPTKAWVLQTDMYLAGLIDDSMADDKHRHSELSASDGSPNPALSADDSGILTASQYGAGAIVSSSGGVLSTIDDEEGNWNPELAGSTGGSGVIYSSRWGRYFIKGGLVTCLFGVDVSSIGTASGNVFLIGDSLPVTPKNETLITLTYGGTVLRSPITNVMSIIADSTNPSSAYYYYFTDGQGWAQTFVTGVYAGQLTYKI
ncbi:MAG: hypothetical protein GY865_06860 [candidate division Zixibacteria bacterium]|nr:hypothetical protein [candidate division Zixibacteria bacterium]